MLQEAVAVNLATKKKVLVTYLDVSKAFDGVWIDGLFFQLREKGIKGKIWRLLYSSYQNFRCKVRISDTYSDWYTMECGIHQGGFLSLLKYVAFIDPLIRILERSQLGCRVADVPTNPIGYADDMASACPSKANIDKSLSIMDNYSRRWRYSYNAKKSAVLVFGEGRREHEKLKKHRIFSLGGAKVPELSEYDHVGIKNCLFDDTMPRTADRISKGRRAFNATLSLGIKGKGINMSTCSLLYWSIIVPIVTYGSEVWVLKSAEIEELRKFQRSIGRRCQRFPKRSPNYSGYAPLGWMSIDRLIQVKKLMFLRTILVLDDEDTCKRILAARANAFSENINLGRLNEFSSPIYDILNTSILVGLYDVCMRMITLGCYFSKTEWKTLVWKKVWECEDEDYAIMYTQPHQKYLLFDIIAKPFYLIWWLLSDKLPHKMKMCETMAALVCDTSRLKASDYRLKKKPFSFKVCSRCDLGCIEDIRHLVMQCPFFEAERNELHVSLSNMGSDIATRILNDPSNYFLVIMGKQPEYASFDSMVDIWLQAGDCISGIYRRAIIGRD